MNPTKKLIDKSEELGKLIAQNNKHQAILLCLDIATELKRLQ